MPRRHMRASSRTRCLLHGRDHRGSDDDPAPGPGFILLSLGVAEDLLIGQLAKHCVAIGSRATHCCFTPAPGIGHLQSERLGLRCLSLAFRDVTI